MCDGVSWVYAAAMVATALSGAYVADSQKKQGQYENEVAQQNAELSDFKAAQVGQIGAIQEEQHRAKVRQMAGSQRANMAANGIDLGSGTAQDIVDETYTLGEADALTIRFNAMNEAWGYRTEASNFRQQGQAALIGGKNAAKGTYLSTAASLIGQGAGMMGAGAGAAAASKGGSTQLTSVATPTNQSVALSPSYGTYSRQRVSSTPRY